MSIDTELHQLALNAGEKPLTVILYYLGREQDYKQALGYDWTKGEEHLHILEKAQELALHNTMEHYKVTR